MASKQSSPRLMMASKQSSPRLLTPGDFKRSKKEPRTLLPPSFFALHKRISTSPNTYIPKAKKTCSNCENLRTITENAVIMTSCFCAEKTSIPTNYLTYELTHSEIYNEMSIESDLPW